MSTITLPTGRKIGDDHPAFIVAEIGQNHNGDVYTATRLLKSAHDAGVDAVKFCKRHIASELTREAYNAPYVGPQSFGRTYGEHREALELSPPKYRHLQDRMRYNQWPEVMFASCCDRKSVDDIEAAINPPLYKIASRDLDNLPLIDYIARLGKPVVLSAGMAGLMEIQPALDAVQRCAPVVLCVCTSEYPTPNCDVGLWRIAYYRERFSVPIGFSDHTPGITAAIAAVALGACYVEKHVTLSRAMPGTDHAGSLEPEALRRLVQKIREVEEMKSECSVSNTLPAYVKLGRSLVTARPLAAGEVITEADVCLKSPGHGIHWPDRAAILGKVCRRALPADVTIDHSDVMEPAYVQ